MKHVKVWLSILAVIASLTYVSSSIFAADGLEISVTPSKLSMASKSTWVTVHTNISYSTFDSSVATIKIDDIEVSWTKSDNNGNLVAKFDASEVKDSLVNSGSTTHVVTFEYFDGTELISATDTIKIMFK